MSRRRILAYALIIAINDPPRVAYQGKPLRAPEADATRLQNALVSLGISPSSIDILSGRAATRQNIIDRLNNIAANPQIHKDTPILIYYAGHGTQAKINIPSLGERKVECICPFDTLTNAAYPIPDITISALLGRIAQKKSKYITLFLDCCHAGSGSRGDAINEASASQDTSQPESETTIDQDALLKLDGELWSELQNIEPDQNSRTAFSDPTSFRYHGVKSHVLIAACREDEESVEYTKPNDPVPRGLFTEALINALVDSQQVKTIWALTHIGLFERIKDTMHDIFEDNRGAFRRLQTPQCEGFYRDRSIFATPASPHQHHAIAPITPDHHGGWLLPVGTLAGVYPRATFEIYDYSPRGELKPIARLAILSVDEAKTKLNAPQNLDFSPDAYAVMCTPPTQLPVEFAQEVIPIWSNRDFQKDLSTRLGTHEPLDRFIVPVRSGHNNKLRISSSSSHSVRIQTTYGSLIDINRPSAALIIPVLSDALGKAVMFFHHLGEPSVVQGANPFELHTLELTEAPIDGWASVDRGYALVPRRGSAPILLHPSGGGGVIPAPLDPRTPFGLHLRSRAPYNYFIYVFYFDPNDFSITPIYVSPSFDRTMPPLPAQSELKIGYEDSGAPPIHFSIDDHVEKDLGFFKVYYSLSSTDMSAIQQDGFDPNESGSSRPARPYHTQSPPAYGSVVYPVTVTNPRRRR